MKKDLIFAPVMLVIGVLLFLLKFTGMTAHIAVSVAGIAVLAVYTVLAKKEWNLPVIEILMRAFYGIALISGIVIKFNHLFALVIVHRASAVLFIVALAFLLVHKLIVKKAK